MPVPRFDNPSKRGTGYTHFTRESTMTSRITPVEVAFRSPMAMRTAKLADLLDWSLTWASHQRRAIKARSPIDDKEVLIPVSTSVNAHRARASLQQVLTHSDKDKVDALFNRIEGDLTKDDDLAELALQLGMIGRKVDERREQRIEEETDDLVASIIQGVVNNLVSEVRVEHTVDGKPIKGQWWAMAQGDGSVWYECRDHDPYVKVETMAGVGGHNRMMHGDPEEVAATQAKAHAATAKKAADRKAHETEVSRRPWVAKRGSTERTAVPDGVTTTGRVYEHPYVDEVTYADGTVIYECNICHEFSNAEKGRPVAHHVGAAHKDRERVGQSEPTHIVSDYPAPAWHRKPHSPKLRSEVLAALDTIEDWHLLSREELATQIEERIMEGRPERQPTEPLTDAEVLARIAVLMDRGQFDHLRQEVNALTAMVTTLTAERDEAATKAEVAVTAGERARRNLQALRELIDEAAVAE